MKNKNHDNGDEIDRYIERAEKERKTKKINKTTDF